MKNNVIFLGCFVTLFSGCTNKFYPGIYENSTCYLYHQPESLVKFNADSTFVCVFPYLDGWHVVGRWSIKHDTLKRVATQIVEKKSQRDVTSEDEFAIFPNLLLRNRKLIKLDYRTNKRTNCIFLRIQDSDTTKLSAF